VSTPETIGRYQILFPLDRAGLGVVYLGQLVGPGGYSATVAVRRLVGLAPASAEGAAFLDRARRAAGVTHASVVQTFDVGVHEGDLYVASELVRGVTLAALTRELSDRGEPLAPDLAVHVASEAAAGLAAAHAKGVVHGELSPGRVLCGFDGRVVVMGFELAGLRAGPPSICTAPEAVRREALDDRADVYSLGAILCEALLGGRLFAQPQPRDAARDVLAARPDVSVALATLVRRCLAAARVDRPTCAELRQALRSLPEARGADQARLRAEIARVFPGEERALSERIRAATTPPR
jgi:serine/threonine protein kinase